jgi:hypothetical protein
MICERGFFRAETMRRYHRLPALLMLIAAFTLGVLYVRTWARPAPSAQVATLAELMAQIAAGKAGPDTWFAYGQRLAEKGDLDGAVLAYRQVMSMDRANHRQARVECALALARAARERAEKEDEFYRFIQDLIHADPRFAMELLERSEFRDLAGRPRFQAARRDARAQAMD